MTGEGEGNEGTPTRQDGVENRDKVYKKSLFLNFSGTHVRMWVYGRYAPEYSVVQCLV